MLGRYTAYFNDFNLFCRPVWARGCTTVQYNFANCQRLVGTAGRLPQIVVTGRMMGYYHLPDRQPLQLKNFSAEPPCSLDPETKLSPEAAAFLQQYPRRDDTLLVGTSDNFSPNYFSRAFEDANVEVLQWT